MRTGGFKQRRDQAIVDCSEAFEGRMTFSQSPVAGWAQAGSRLRVKQPMSINFLTEQLGVKSKLPTESVP